VSFHLTLSTEDEAEPVWDCMGSTSREDLAVILSYRWSSSAIHR
jgi:hypothetical protein